MKKIFKCKTSLRTQLYLFVLLGICSNPIFSKVSKYAYLKEIKDLDDSTIIVPHGTVAHAEYVYVREKVENVEELNPFSIFFVIDHSGSMCFNTHTNDNPQDQWGHRFTVISRLLDTLYEINPTTWVGAVVFRQYLYLHEDDHDFITKFSDEPYGGYIPLLQLDSIYKPGNKSGYEILKEILQTAITSDPYHNTFHPHDQFSDLKYRPSNHDFNATWTNINAGFNAAKEAMKFSPHNKEKHNILFFSDGMANISSQGPVDTYIAGEDVPPTFTVYFTKYGTVTQELKKMTENIQKNGYSSKNPRSEVWPYYNTTAEKLTSFLYNSVLRRMFGKNVLIPKRLVVNGITNVGEWDGNKFLFPDLFSLHKKPSPFTMKLTYQSFFISDSGDTVNKPDVKRDYSFSVKVDTDDPLSKSFESFWWDRTIRFYAESKPIKTVKDSITIKDSINEFEIRFTEIEGDTKYNYKDVSLTIWNEMTSPKDKEELKLKKKGDYFFCTVRWKKGKEGIPSDDLLQLHSRADVIHVAFRNPKLELDTLRAQIPFKGAELELELAVEVICPIDPQEYTIPSALKVGDFKKGIPIIIEPQVDIPKKILTDVSVGIQIYDAVGNLILSKRPESSSHLHMEQGIKDIKGTKDKGRIVLIWDGQNSNSRFVGYGTYLAVCTILFRDAPFSSERVFIALKEEPKNQ